MKISLKAARVNAGLTQDEVAKITKKSKSTIVSYEKGRTQSHIGHWRGGFYRIKPGGKAVVAG